MRLKIGNVHFQELLIIYIIIWSIAPPLQIDMIYRLLALGCAGLWALLALNKGINQEMKYVYSMLFAVVVAVVVYVEKGTFDAVLQQIAIYILVVSYIMNGYYQDRWERIQWFLPLILILLAYYNWTTASKLIEDHTIARKLVRADEEIYVYMRQGVGGYSLIYPQVCIFPAVAMWVRRSVGNDFKCTLIGVIWFGTYIYCILNAGYSLALFVTFASFLVLWVGRGRNGVAAVLLTIVIFIIGLWAIVSVDAFREFLLQQFDGTAVAKKIQDLVATTEEGAAEGSIYDRIEVYKGSLQVIFDYPLIGSLWNLSGGGHSAFLDVMGKYGVWGFAVYAMMIFHVPNYYKKRYPCTTIYGLSNATVVALLFVGMLDAFNYSFMCMILLVMPLLYEDILKWEKLK